MPSTTYNTELSRSSSLVNFKIPPFSLTAPLLTSLYPSTTQEIATANTNAQLRNIPRYSTFQACFGRFLVVLPLTLTSMNNRFKVTKRQKRPWRQLTSEEAARRVARFAEQREERNIEEERQQVITDRMGELIDSVKNSGKRMREQHRELEQEIKSWEDGMEYAFVAPDFIENREAREAETIDRRRRYLLDDNRWDVLFDYLLLIADLIKHDLILHPVNHRIWRGLTGVEIKSKIDEWHEHLVGSNSLQAEVNKVIHQLRAESPHESLSQEEAEVFRKDIFGSLEQLFTLKPQVTIPSLPRRRLRSKDGNSAQ